ncbi:hypothetical protein T12_2163 [Trichinella patagoniensis]|uniref:Uncharacterized protein n=1 Tax=Trichinella patagoniensis TaxID=990121 RepID=A0A0V1AGH3_9BILA|nr:hypothetical protein T12_2163 [Trichinella patagoniensis]
MRQERHRSLSVCVLSSNILAYRLRKLRNVCEVNCSSFNLALRAFHLVRVPIGNSLISTGNNTRKAEMSVVSHLCRYFYRGRRSPADEC